MTSILRTAFVNVLPNTDGFSAELSKRLKAIDASREGGQAGAGFGKKFSESAHASIKEGLGKGLAVLGIGAGIGEALSEGIKGSLEIGAANDKLRAQLNLTKEESGRLGSAAGKLFSQGYGSSMDDVNDAIRSVVTNIPSMRNASIPVLQDISKGGLDISRVFGTDVNEVMASVSSMMKSGLAPNAKTALDIITKGFQTGADKGGDLLDTFTEYSVQFKKLGLDGPTSLGIINQLLAGGARNADVAADAVKEFSIRAIDGSKTTVAGYKILNLNAAEFAQKIAAGGPAAKQAFDTVVTKINSIQDPVKRNTAGVDLFGTKWEDLGNSFRNLNVKTATDGLGKVAGATKNLADQSDAAKIQGFVRAIQSGFASAFGSAITYVNNLVAANREKLQGALQAISSVFTKDVLPALRGFASILTGSVIPAVGSVVGFFAKHVTTTKALAIAIGALVIVTKAHSAALAVEAAGGLVKYLASMRLVTTATKVWTAVQVAFNFVLSANPIGIVIAAIVALGAAVVIAYKKSDTFRAIVQGAWQGVKTAVSAVVTWFTNTVLPVLKKVYDGIAAAAMWLWHNVIEPAWHGIQSVVNVVVAAVRAYLNAMKAEFNVIATVVKWLYSNIFQPLFTAIGFIVKAAWVVIQIALAAMRLYFQNVIAPVVKWLYNNVFLPVWTSIKLVVSTTVTAVRAVLNAMKAFFENVIAPVVRWLYNNVIRPVFTSIGTFITFTVNNVIKPIFTALKAAFSAVGSALKAVWDNVVRPMFSAFGNFLKNTVDPAFSKGVDAIKAAWKRVQDAARVPVAFVVNHVINPLVNGINAAASFVGVKDRIPPIQGFDSGGQIPGVPSFRDNMLAAGPGGMPIGVASGEFITNTKSTMANFGLVHAINKKRGRVGLNDILPHVDGYDSGGLVGAIGGFFKKVISGAKGVGSFITNPGEGLAKIARSGLNLIPGSGPMLQFVKGAAMRVINGAKDWLTNKIQPPGPPLGSMTWPWIVQMAQQLVPGIKPISTFREGAVTLTGNRSYHAIGDAVDFPPSLALARAWRSRFGSITNEMITPWNNLNLWNGKPHTYTGAVWNQHNFAGGNAHDHIAVSGSLGGGLPGGGGSVGGTLGAWINAAIRATGVPASWASGLKTLIMRESGGNPNSVNRTDANARAGHPSQGLAQVIPSTFAQYRVGSLPNNILNPVANIAAAIRYILSRYGSISNVQQANPNLPPKGYALGGLIKGRGLLPFGSYDSGGYLPTGISLAHNGTGRPEPVGHGLGGNTYSINVTVAPGAHPAETGREIVTAIQAYERANGRRWRAS